MRNTAVLFFLLFFVASAPSYSQDKSEIRRARREQRRAERAVLDSIRAASYAEDSVNVGYGYVKRKHLTNSVSKVDVNDTQIRGYSDIGEYLQGRVPGLIVTKVGGSYKYSIRGINSINSPTDPLFVVDGSVVMDITHLNPSDIKSVEVLKDASASIYGARGACGVILITTRR